MISIRRFDRRGGNGCADGRGFDAGASGMATVGALATAYS
jgi:hypothetical protein